MKKNRILRGALALVVLFAVVIACRKQEDAKVNQSNSEIVTISKEDDMNAYLKQFKEKMQSATKNNETLLVEDARWHLEALLNYTYGDAGRQTSDIQCDTFYYKMPINGGEITLAQLNEAFVALSQNVQYIYADCNLPDKSILAIQTMFENNSKDSSVTVRTILSMRGLTTFSMWFDSTDYWGQTYYDLGDGFIVASGKCGAYQGECPESGAPLELTKKLNLRIPKYACLQRSGYFTDEHTITVSIYSPDIDDWDFLNDDNSPCRYKLYYQTEDPHFPRGANPSGCICPEDMNYYLSKGPEIINHYQPDDKVIISAYYQSSSIVGIGKTDNCFHELVLSYGVFHCNDNGGGLDD